MSKLLSQGDISKVSSYNSTTTALTASSTYSGTWEEVYHFASISIIAASDVAGTLYADFSTDGATNNRAIQLSDGTSGAFGIHSLIPISRYFRTRVVNGGSNQSTFYVQTLYHINSRIAQPTSRLSQSINDYSDVINSRSVIVAKNTLGDYVNVEADIDGRLKISDGITGIFGESISIEYTPYVQSSHTYGIESNSQLHNNFLASGGTITASTDGNSTIISTDTSVGSYAVIRSQRVAKYRHGYGIICRVEGKFTTGVANSLQFLGLGNAQSDLYFCMNGTDFGVRRSYGGLLEIRKLTVSAAAAGVENLTITLNGTAYSFNVSNAGGATSFTAHEIESGSAYGSLWSIEHNGSEVIFIAKSVGARSGTYSFVNNTGGGTAAAAFTQLKAGASLTSSFIAQADWNSSSDLITTLDAVSYHNLYEIQYSWFGTSNIIFRVYNTTNGKFETVHTMTFANTSSTYSLTSPNMYIQRGVASLGSTTALTLESSGSFVGLLGSFNLQKQPKQAVSNSAVALSAGVERVVLTLSNRLQINGYSNQSEIILQSLSCSADGNRPVTVKIVRNPTTLSANTTTDYTSFTVVSTDGLLRYDTTTDTYTGGEVLQEFVVGKNISTTLEFIGRDIYMTREDIIIITAISSQANTFDVACSVISDI